MPADVIPLGARLRHRREELGLTQAQAARELDVARTAYRLWEMEAARPAPDRWRTIASWLGITVNALLLAAELLDEAEAADGEHAARSSGLSAGGWDEQTRAADGDFFSQERLMIAAHSGVRGIPEEQADRLRAVLARIQGVSSSDGGRPGWHPGRFRKRVANTELAPTVARAALGATAVGVPAAVLDDAGLLVSELVANTVKHADSEWVDLGITLDAHRLRVEVGDQSTRVVRPRVPDAEGGWGLTLVAEIAHRWGVERTTTGKTVWFELDLAPPP